MKHLWKWLGYGLAISLFCGPVVMDSAFAQDSSSGQTRQPFRHNIELKRRMRMKRLAFCSVITMCCALTYTGSASAQDILTQPTQNIYAQNDDDAADDIPNFFGGGPITYEEYSKPSSRLPLIPKNKIIDSPSVENESDLYKPKYVTTINTVNHATLSIMSNNGIQKFMSAPKGSLCHEACNSNRTTLMEFDEHTPAEALEYVLNTIRPKLQNQDERLNEIYFDATEDYFWGEKPSGYDPVYVIRLGKMKKTISALDAYYTVIVRRSGSVYRQIDDRYLYLGKAW